MRAKNNTRYDPDAGTLPSNPGVGPGAANMRNPKRQSGGRRDVIRNEGADAGGELNQSGMVGTSNYWAGQTSANRADKGSNGTVPDPSILNRGYTEVTGTPAEPPCISADRIFEIPDPTLTLHGDTSTESSPNVPRYGTGGD